MESGNPSIKLAQAFVEKARSDLHSAKSLLKSGDYADSAYHAQQCAEKAVKAVLVLSNKFVRTHTASGVFRRVIESLEPAWKSRLKDLIPKIEELEEHWVLSRYPEPHGKDVWNPVKEYTMERSEEAIENAEVVLETLTNFLREKYGLAV